MIAGTNAKKPRDHVTSVETDCVARKGMCTGMALIGPDVIKRTYQKQTLTNVLEIPRVSILSIMTT